MKCCVKCGETKHLSGFRFRKDTKKYRNSCLDCDKLYFAKIHIKNRDKNLLISKKWYSDNKERAICRTKQWRLKNKDKVLKNRSIENKNNKYRYHNDEGYRARKIQSVRKWQDNNKDAIKKHKSKLNVRIADNLRSRLRSAIKNESKNGSAVRDLGCTIEYFKRHIESLWQPGMTWKNYGFYGWHIDHIVPLANFDLSRTEHIRKACHYTNLQPLWANDNLKKGAKTNK